MMICGERIYSNLEEIAFTRPAGTAEEKKAADILCGKIRKLGLTPQLESFKIDEAETAAEMRVTEPYEKSYEVRAFKHAKSTPEEGVTAEFIYYDDVAESNYAKLKNKLCLFNRYTCGEKKLAELGIAGLLQMDGKATDDPESTDLYQAEFRKKENRDLISAFTIRGRDALEMMKRGAEKTWFRLINRSCEAQSQNVTVTLPGSGLPDEIIVVGAHYDSVPVGQGACDNGAGSAIILELLRLFSEHRPQRTLRFVWFGAEEVGLWGSKAYLKTHEDELTKHRLMINVDVGGSVMGSNFVRVTAEESVAHYIDFLAKELGYIADIKQGLMGSDSTPFADKKIPAVGFGRGEAAALQFCHSRNDTMEYISAKALQDTAEFVWRFTDKVCRAKSFPIPETIPDNMVKRVDEMLGKYADEKPKQN